jgi:hypothetical protein
MDNLVFATDTSGAKAPGCHGYPARRLATSGVQFALESLSSLPWTGCPVCGGIGVHFAAEYASSEYITHRIQARGRQLPQPSALVLLRRQDVLDLELPPPDLSPYGAIDNAAEGGDGHVDH